MFGAELPTGVPSHAGGRGSNLQVCSLPAVLNPQGSQVGPGRLEASSCRVPRRRKLKPLQRSSLNQMLSAQISSSVLKYVSVLPQKMCTVMPSLFHGIADCLDDKAALDFHGLQEKVLIFFLNIRV